MQAQEQQPESVCTICYDDLEPGVSTKQCPICPLRFHIHCAMRWLITQYNEGRPLITCPNCRGNMRPLFDQLRTSPCRFCEQQIGANSDMLACITCLLIYHRNETAELVQANFIYITLSGELTCAICNKVLIPIAREIPPAAQRFIINVFALYEFDYAFE